VAHGTAGIAIHTNIFERRLLGCSPLRLLALTTSRSASSTFVGLASASARQLLPARVNR
jgi:hypothetical protein